MKRIRLAFTILFIINASAGLFAQRFWVSASASNWNNTANWSAVSGGPGGASVPGASDLVTFNALGLGNCTIDIVANVAGITVNGYTGTIDINGFDLTTTGTNLFTTGTITNTGGVASLTLNTVTTSTFNGTTITANLNGSSGRIFFNGSTFNGTVNVNKTDNNNDNNTGNNIFNGTTTITNLGGGHVLLGNAIRDQFNGVTTFNNNGNNRFYFANNHAGQTTTFATDVILNTNKAGGVDAWSFLIAEGANTNVSFGGNLTINCAGTLQSNHRILQGAGSQATYSGTVTVNPTNTNAATVIQLGTVGTSIYNGNIVVGNTGGISGVFFNTSASASSTLAATRTISLGAGFSVGTLSLLRFTQTGATAQTLNTFSGTASLIVGPASSFGGDVDFRAPQIFLNGCAYGGTANIEKTGATNNTGSGGNTFASTTTITNNGTGQLRTNAGNTFNGLTNIINNSTSDILLELVSGGTYNGDVTFTNTNSSSIRVAFLGATTFNGNIIVNSTAGTGINFCESATATATLNAGTITIGGSGFSTGTLNLVRFTQVGAINQTLNTFTGTANLTVGPSSTFGGDVDFRAPQIFLNGCAYGGTATIEKTGATNNTGSGGNTFASITTITNNGTGVLRTNAGNTFNGPASIINNSTSDIMLEVVSGGTYNGNVTFTNTNSSSIRVAFLGATTFNGNIIVNSTAGTGINFCESASATATLNAGTITIGGSGFSTGTLNLVRFTQVGAINQTLNTFTGTANLTVGPSSTFGGNVDFRAPQILLNGCTYGGTATIEKTGATDNAGIGGNIFTGIATITNSGTGYLMTGNGTRDQFLSTATFNNTGSYRMYFGHNHPGQTTTFASDLTLTSNKTGGVDQFSFLIAENGTSAISITGNLLINCAGAIRSDHRLLNGVGSLATYNGTVTINETNTNASTVIQMGTNGTSTYNGNIIVSNTGGAAGITFNANVAATSTLNGSISIAGGFSSGTLNLFRLNQVGALAQNLTLTNNGTILAVGPNSEFDGDVNFVSPRLLLNGTIYQGTAYLEKIGTTNDDGNGGNTFNSTSTIVNTGSGYLLTGNAGADIFNGALTITNTGSNYIYLAHNIAGNQFNNNITLNNTGSALGIRFSNNVTGSSTFSAGVANKILVGTGFGTGELGLRRFTQTGTSAQALTLTGNAQLVVGPTSQFDGAVTFISPRLLLNGTTFNDIAYLEKNGATNDDGNGGNVFNALATIVNSGSAYIRTAVTTADIFNANLILINSGASTIRLADNVAGNQFNGNIEVNSTFGGGIYFGNNAAGTSTLAAGKTIAVGTTGVISGDIRLIRFTQVGPTAQTLDLSGIAILTLGPSSTFGGDVDFKAPQLLLNGTTYNGTTFTRLEKKGATDNAGNGGNIFNSPTTTLTDSGSGYLLTANTTLDIFNTNLTVTNTGSSIIYLAHNVPGSQFNGDISFNSTLGSGGVYFANNVGGNATLGNGASLLVGGLGYSSGELRFRRFTQIGNANQTLLLTGTGLLRIGPTSTFNGILDFRAPRISLDGCIYNGITYIEKTGATNDDSSGGNVFNGTTTLANSGSGWFRNAVTTLDSFNGNLTLTNTGSATIRMADNIPGTVFNGNLIVNSTNPTAGSGIYFCNNSVAATATLATGLTISVGVTGFTAGELRLSRFTQTGSTNQNLVLAGTSILQLGATSTFNGNVDFRSPQLFLNGTTFNGTAYLEKTGATNNTGTGNNIFASTTSIVNSGTGVLRTNGSNTFNGTTTILNSSSADLLLELITGSTYNGDVTFTNTGSSNIRVAFLGTTAFNGNVLVNSTSGIGIYFAESVAATATLAATKTISVGGTGFTVGELRLQRFTQVGATAQSLTLTAGSTFRSGPSATWNGSLTVSSSILYLDGSTLNGATNAITKTGGTIDPSVGGNIFGGSTTFTNSGTGTFRFANATTDDFTGDAIFNQASGSIQPAYNIASTFRGNVSVNGSTVITFGSNNGTITFAGGNTQTVNRLGSASPVFRRLLMSKSANAVSLNTDVSVTTNATFTTGVLNTTATNIINFANGSTVTGGSNASHVDGPVTKIGNAVFSFPTGDLGIYRPLSITSPAVATDAFRAEYFKTTQPYGATYAAGIQTVSTCEYWLLNRTVGASNVNVTLSWNSPDCTAPYITDQTTLLVARWNGASWVNHGNASTTGNATTGTITSSVLTSFAPNPSPITLGSTTLSNPLPVELIDFSANVNSGQVDLKWTTASELNNDYFSIQRSVDGFEYVQIGRVDGAGTTNQQKEYKFTDKTPIEGQSYYRLKQTDVDKKAAYSNVVIVDLLHPNDFSLHPNPTEIGTIVTSNSSGDFIILNSLGSVVLKISNTNKLDVSTLSPGVYIIRNGRGKTQKLIIK